MHGPAGTGEFLQAFREYGVEVSTLSLAAHTGEPALPVTPDAVCVAASNEPRLTDRSAQVEALGELTGVANWQPLQTAGAGTGPNTAWSAIIGSTTPVRVVGPEGPGDGIAADSWLCTVGQAQRFGVDTVSLHGGHVVQAAFSHRIDVVGGVETLRHRITVTADERSEIADLALRAVEACGVVSGAGHVQIERGSAGLACVEVLGSPSPWSVPSDAAYHAFGHSHQHLLAESVVQPQAFARRLKRPPQERGLTLAVAYLPGPPDADFGNPDAGQLIRRLPGFVGLHRTPGATGSAGESLWGRVIFIHSDRPLILHSLSVLHELADSGQLWDTRRRFIDFAGRIS